MLAMKHLPMKLLTITLTLMLKIDQDCKMSGADAKIGHACWRIKKVCMGLAIFLAYLERTDNSCSIQ